jgi:hypothetical protein
MDFQLNTAIGGIALGASGFLSVLATDWMRARHERRLLATALSAELQPLIERYDDLMDDRPQRDWTLPSAWPPWRASNLFAVYDGNTNRLGLFDHRSVAALVRAYTLAKQHHERANAAPLPGHPTDRTVLDQIDRQVHRDARSARQAAAEAIALLRRFTSRGFRLTRSSPRKHLQTARMPAPLPTDSTHPA